MTSWNKNAPISTILEMVWNQSIMKSIKEIKVKIEKFNCQNSFLKDNLSENSVNERVKWSHWWSWSDRMGADFDSAWSIIAILFHIRLMAHRDFFQQLQLCSLNLWAYNAHLSIFHLLILQLFFCFYKFSSQNRNLSIQSLTSLAVPQRSWNANFSILYI